MSKSPDAFRTISEVSEWLDTPTYVLRFWESRFPQIKPVKRAGGRRYYRPEDMMLLGGIKKLLHFEELTIKAAKSLLKDKGVKHVMDLSPDLNTPVVTPPSAADAADKADIAKMVQAAPSEKPKPKVEVRVVKRAKQAEDDPIAAEETAPSPEETPVIIADDPKAEATDELAADTAETAVEPEKPQNEADQSTDDQPKPMAADEAVDAAPALAPAALAKAEEADRQAAAQEAAEAKAASDEEANSWAGLVPDMVMNAPFRIGMASDYDAETLSEIEMLYYSLRMARNGMRRSIAQQEKRAS